jgi:hypothetical protein
MPKYLIQRNFGRVDDEKMKDYGERSATLVKYEFIQVTWEHSHVVVAPDGSVTTFCIYSAPNESLVHEHADRLGGHTIESIWEIGGDISPLDFTV